MRDPGSLEERLFEVTTRIAAAIAEAERDPGDVTLIVVSKFHPASLVRELVGLGVREFGENRHQEAREKAAELSDLELGWNFIGQLQSKKARQVRSYAHSVHSLDRLSVIEALGRPAEATPESATPESALPESALPESTLLESTQPGPTPDSAPDRILDGFVQLNLTDDPGRGGVRDADLESVAEAVLTTPGVRLLGVMAVAPIGEEPRRAFERLRRASERVRAISPEARYISAGMSGDFVEAILEGATHLRIGSAITGNRPTAG